MSRGLSFSASRARRRRGGFSPQQYPEVSAWWMNTATSGAVSSLTEVLSGNHAVQGNASRRPTGATSSNGMPVLSFDGVDDFLSSPINGPTNGSPRWGYAAWIRPATVTGVHMIIGYTTIGGASASKIAVQQTGTDVFVNVYYSTFVVRRGTAAGILALNTWGFLTVEFDGDQSAEADECIITWNGTKQTLSFTNDSATPNDMPDTLVQPTGNLLIGDVRAASPLQPWSGLIGTHQLILQGPGGISGGGLISAAKRANLMNFGRPT